MPDDPLIFVGVDPAGGGMSSHVLCVSLAEAEARKQIDAAMNALIASGGGQVVPFVEVDDDWW